MEQAEDRNFPGVIDSGKTPCAGEEGKIGRPEYIARYAAGDSAWETQVRAGLVTLKQQTWNQMGLGDASRCILSSSEEVS